jgi:lipopolysaccharide transport system ATP-binding protein/teichoic acid transport system ATP-binding protein
VVEDLWVTFRASRDRPTLRDALTNRRNNNRTMMVEALAGVSFEIPHGSVCGVIGRNGAGKSTLLRCVAGILPPTSGRLTVWGRVTPLLSLGLGFNRELTGRDNILLGGLTLGLTEEEITEHADEIEEFAGLGHAINFPMRTYSSGMFGRLAFAVAAHLDPEILLVDEALSAGDASFRHKCTQKIVELCEADCTVLIVSHGLEVVKELAQYAIWLDRGTLLMDGRADQVIDAYFEENEIDPDEMSALEDV